MGYRMVIYKGVWILKITSDILLLKHSLLKPEDLKFGSSLPIVKAEMAHIWDPSAGSRAGMGMPGALWPASLASCELQVR